jgi:hypothetical protein
MYTFCLGKFCRLLNEKGGILDNVIQMKRGENIFWGKAVRASHDTQPIGSCKRPAFPATVKPIVNAGSKLRSYNDINMFIPSKMENACHPPHDKIFCVRRHHVAM